MTSDELFFFSSMPDALPLYAALSEKLLAAFPSIAVEVKKTQITFREKYGFACNLTVMEEGEHWFHTPEQLAVLRDWEAAQV